MAFAFFFSWFCQSRAACMSGSCCSGAGAAWTRGSAARVSGATAGWVVWSGHDFESEGDPPWVRGTAPAVCHVDCGSSVLPAGGPNGWSSVMTICVAGLMTLIAWSKRVRETRQWPGVSTSRGARASCVRCTMSCMRPTVALSRPFLGCRARLALVIVNLRCSVVVPRWAGSDIV